MMLSREPQSEIPKWSKLTFWWLYPILKQGCQRPLEVKDLVPITSEHTSSFLCDLLQRYWDKEVKASQYSKKGPSFLRAIIKCFGLSFFAYGLFEFVEQCVLKIGAPIFLGHLIRYFNNEPGYTDTVGYTLAFLIILCYFGALLCYHPYFYGVQTIGMKIRVAVSALIYRKALKLSASSMKRTTVGQMVNLLSNDVNRFDSSVCYLHFLWIGPVQTLIITAILWFEIGPLCLAGMILMVLYVPIQSYIGKLFCKFRLSIAQKTDERVRLMHEIVTSIKVIKMYAWENSFKALVEKARRLEIDTIMKLNYLRTVNSTLIQISSKLICFIIFLVYVITGNALTAEKVFVTIALINNVRTTMTVYFYTGISQGSECWTSCNRIQSFLEMEEKSMTTNCVSNLRPKSMKCRLMSTNLYARWNMLESDDHLSNISFIAKSGELLALIGPVGSGKSSLIHAILGELPARRGSISFQGRVSYASQEPWVFSGTIRENIIYGQSYLAKRYSEVIKVCALEKDFESFCDGDQTLVGEQGMSLSGGQRARINLARAVYLEADIYLLDDPLSAVDAHVSNHLFKMCISGFLKSKIVILATHQQQFIKTADQVLLLKNGYVEAQGTYDEIKRQGFDFSLILSEDEQESIKEKSQSKDTDDYLLTNITRLRRASETWSLLHGSTGNLSDIGVDNRSLLGMDAEEGSYVSLQQEDLFGPNPEEITKEVDRGLEKKATGKVGSHVYMHYLSLGSGWLMVLFLFMTAISAQIFFICTDYWLSYWTTQERRFFAYIIENGNTTEPNIITESENRMFYVYIYSLIMMFLIGTSLIRSGFFFRTCMKSSIKLHNNMFAAAIRVPMFFYETHPIGQILNRFTKDTGQIDDLLPICIFDTVIVFLYILAIVIMVSYINVWTIIPTAVLVCGFMVIRWVYLSSGRDIKRLEGITRSPVFSHLSSTFEGLTTVRAFGSELSHCMKFDEHQDLHTAAWVMHISATRLFGIYLDFLAASFIAVVTIGFLLQKDALSGNVGFSLSLAMTLGGALQWGICKSAEAESHMISVERILEYSKMTPEESPQPDKKLNDESCEWPSKGEIDFHNVYLYYDEKERPVLNNISFSIHSGEKIGIVGRTGAGKSSLISCLFRLTIPKGAILIDDVRTDALSLDKLRSSISIIPQDAAIFSGTLRYNLDPFSQYSDEAIWNALQEVQLKSVVKNMSGGLMSMINDGGGNLSIGQKQLVCLARAILKQNKILIMDEATANVDPETDNWIQQTIRKKFETCTVLTIAHRLQTIMDSDRIMVLDSGRLMEFSQPYQLLQNPKSLLTSLVEDVGGTSAILLKNIAHQAFMKKIGTESRSQCSIQIIVSDCEDEEDDGDKECTRL